MANRIPISELEETLQAQNGDYIAVDNGTETKKINVENFNNSSNQTAKAYAESSKTNAENAEQSATEAASTASEIVNKINQAASLVNEASVYASEAAGSAEDAGTAYTNAARAATNAAASASSAETSALTANDYLLLAKSWAQGNTGARADEATNNARYWSDVARGAAGGGVTTFNGRYGVVVPEDSDYNAGQISYDDTASDIGADTVQDAVEAVKSAISGTQSSVDDIKNSIGNTDISQIGDGTLTGAVDSVNTTLNAVSDAAYKTTDSIESEISDEDYLPFYDTSGQSRKKIQVSNLNLTGGGGSTITVMTDETDLLGKAVNVTDGILVFGGTFDDSGKAVIEGVTITGELIIMAQGTSETADTTIEVPYFGNYEAKLSFYVVYGFRVDSTQSSPSGAVTYHVAYNGEYVENYDYTPGYMDFTNDKWVWRSWTGNEFFMPRPVLISQDYKTKVYLNTDDLTKDVDGNDVTAMLTGATDGYNAMMEWGRDNTQIWYKLVPDGNDPTSYTVFVANKKIDSGFVAWSFYDQNDKMVSHFYTSIYAGATVNNVLRSLSGKSRNQTTAGATQIAQAKANNQNGEAYAWYIDVFADRILINFLMILVIRSLNSDVIGYGNYTGGSGAGNMLTTGTGNTKGMFYGKQANAVCKVFGMENWFADAWRRMAGLILSSGALLYKLTYGTADGSSAAGYIENDNAPTNYISSGILIATNLGTSYIVKQTAKADGALIPSGFNGANNTYYSDACWSSTGVKFALVGGYCSNGSACGAFALNLVDALSYSGWNGGCGLSLKPVA